MDREGIRARGGGLLSGMVDIWDARMWFWPAGHQPTPF